MNKRDSSGASVFFILASFILSSTAVSDVASLASECDDCHGQDGVSEWSDVPTIGGISAFVGADALFFFLDRERPCISSEYRRGDTDREPTDMCVLVDSLTEDEIEEIAEYYAAKTFVAAKQEFDAGKVAAGREIHDRDCEKCHIDGGTNPEEDAGIIAGQWSDYLRQSFDAYVSGEREAVKKMKEKMAPLSEQDIDALVHFYASQQ